MSDIGEFSFGSGQRPPLASGAPITPYERLRATRMTDSANPEANEDDVWSVDVTRTHMDEDENSETYGTSIPGTLRPEVTQPVTEEEFAPSTGQHRIIRTDRFNPARNGYPKHYPDGYQDGSGEEWRDSVPPNPVV